MKRSIGFSKNLSTLDGALPGINHNRIFLGQQQCLINTIEEEESDSNFISQLMQPKNYKHHKGFMSYYTMDPIAAIGEAIAISAIMPIKCVSIDTPLQLPEVYHCDFMTSGCEKFDRILTLKEDRNKKRCMTPNLSRNEIIYEDHISIAFPPRLPHLTINLSKVNYIDADGKIQEVRNSPISVTAVDEEILAIENNDSTVHSVHSPRSSSISCPVPPNTPPLRGGRALICARRSQLAN